jgi:hypothetical protein
MPQSNSERDLAIVEMYALGETSADIGNKLGISRQRVHQILGRIGAVTAEDARRVRSEVRATELSEAVSQFLREYGSVLKKLAALGIPRAEVESRFGLVLPALPAAIVREGLSKAGILFNVDVQEYTFSNSVIEGAVWFILSRELELDVDPVAAVSQIDVAAAAELTETLQSEGLETSIIADIIIAIEAARSYILVKPETGLPKHRFDTHRTDILVELGIQSGKGTAPWPPTSQTVMKRLGAGSWADALIAIGLTPDKRGRPRGLLAYTESQYLEAIAKFLISADQTGRSASYEAYGTWVDQEERAGRHWPSQASVRLRFGNWTNAKRSAVGGDPATRESPIARQQSSEAALALHHAQSEIQQLFERLKNSASPESRNMVEGFVRSYVQEFEFRRRTWIRSMVEADAGAVARRLGDPQLPAKQRAALVEIPPNISKVLTDMNIDRLSNPRDSGGWLGPDAQAELDAIPGETIAKYSSLREARNFFVHNSTEAQERLKSRLAELAEINPLFELKQQLTTRVFLVWLLGAEARRLRLLLDCVPNIWRSAVVAETVNRGL